jgi:hypothetical protein
MAPAPDRLDRPRTCLYSGTMQAATTPRIAFVWRHAWWVSLLVLPFVVIWPVYAGLSADPIFMQSGLLAGGSPGWVDGLSNLDLNVGATTQALGHLAAEQWLRGQVPWWNPYNGLGMPLAGEMQASALFMPFVLLLHFQNGPLLLKIAMQMMAGPAMFVLLRRLAVTPALAWLGGLIFALNGSFAWLGHGPIMPIAFLPLFLIGIENARTGGFRLIALALSLSIYAGFPETAYVNGLLALAWAALRFWQSAAKLRFARAVGLGGLLGLLLAAPALWSFAHMLMHGSAANHAVFNFELDSPPAPTGLYAVWLFPYLVGPLQTFTAADPTGGMDDLISNLGGYIGLATLMLALLALSGRSQRALRWVLAAWIVLCVLRIAAVPGATQAINLIPLLRQTIMSRYARALRILPPRIKLRPFPLHYLAIRRIGVAGVQHPWRVGRWLGGADGIAGLEGHGCHLLQQFADMGAADGAAQAFVGGAQEARLDGEPDQPAEGQRPTAADVERTALGDGLGIGDDEACIHRDAGAHVVQGRAGLDGAVIGGEGVGFGVDEFGLDIELAVLALIALQRDRAVVQELAGGGFAQWHGG